MSAQKTIRYGIIGFGEFAEKTIAPAIRRARNSTVVALQKRSAAAARQKADECSIPLAFDSPEDLAQHPDIDAVYIASANCAHCRETLAAAKAHKHVIVEKPMALDARQAECMISACAENGVKLMVAHMIRLSPIIRRVRQLSLEGRIGELKCARAEFVYDARKSARRWLIDRDVAGGGPVFDIGVHCIDTLRYVLGGEPVAVAGVLSPAPSEKSTEESALLALRFPQGVIASVFSSYTAPFTRVLFEIIGTEGIITVSDFQCVDRLGRLTIMQGRGEKPSTVNVEEIFVPNLYVDEISMFTDWILGGAEVEIDGANGLANQRVIDKAMAL
ncbi:MAG TPA: Gfo/Idh/MocA family oxidoreductase [Bacteroidota bacterium]|nr:Gfo/Idh/MocA family oxidoreductase [Bacteroidota bacterium]